MITMRKVDTITAWAIVDRDNPRIIPGEIYEESRKKEFILEKEEEWVKVKIIEIK